LLSLNTDKTKKDYKRWVYFVRSIFIFIFIFNLKIEFLAIFRIKNKNRPFF